MPATPPPRPDTPSRAGPARRSPVLTYGLPAAIAWLGGALLAWRHLGWYPPATAPMFFLLGWVPFLGIGFLLNRVGDATARKSIAASLAVFALALPSIAADTVPGVKQPPEDAIPGMPWLALTAAPDGTFDLYLMKGDARHLVALGETPWNEEYPVLSPDHRHIAFPANRFGTYDLFVMDLDAQGNPVGTHRLTDGAGDETSPVWSPDGSRIAYNEVVGDAWQIDVIDAIGGTPRALTSGPDATGPAWSPGGGRIAYAAANPQDPENEDIWVMRADGSHPRDVIDATPDDWWPNWSPDGSRIAFTGGYAASWDVYVAGSDGSSVRNLTVGSTDKDEASGWSPDGTRVLFLSDRSHTGGTFLYFTDATDGSDVRLALRI